MPLETPPLLTTKVRETMVIVSKILNDPDGILQPNSRIADRKDRYFNLVNDVAKVCTETAGQQFNTVLYPMSQTDISTAAYFINGRQGRLFTIDDGNLYSQNQEDSRTVVADALNRRVIAGMDQHGTNRGIPAYAMELVLLGVEPENFQVTEIQDYPTPGKTNQTFPLRVKSVFTTEAGLAVEHTNLARVFLPQGNDPIPQPYLNDALEDLVTQNSQVLLLRKAGGYQKTTRTLYPFLPNRTIVISDLDEKGKYLEGTGYGEKLEDLVTGEALAALSALNQKHSLPNPALRLGYANDLTNLRIYRYNLDFL